jgi:hypothetical protein
MQNIAHFLGLTNPLLWVEMVGLFIVVGAFFVAAISVLLITYLFFTIAILRTIIPAEGEVRF